ncbi:MAG: hypothetical protein F6K28_62645 [Microcoleus sp. SIO2G3]|nr:hypothetical protein [Microcoleus sp. SIO2G3]
MGWLDRWKEAPKDQEQLGLFGEDQALVPQHRVDGATVQKALQAEVKQRRGNAKTHAQLNAIVTRNLLECSVDELYEQTGGVKNDRSSLPQEAQEALMVGDLAARHEIVTQDAQGHQQILKAGDAGSKKARRILPW